MRHWQTEFLLFAAGALLVLSMMPLANLVSFSKWYPDFKWQLALVSFSFLFYGVMSLAMYSLLFKMRYQKGKIWGYYVPALLICLTYIALIEYDMFVGNGNFRHKLFYTARMAIDLHLITTLFIPLSLQLIHCLNKI